MSVAPEIEARFAARPLSAPSPSQTRLFGHLIMDLDPDLGWWYARCPFHDPQNHFGRSVPSAMINFAHGSFRCLADDPCTRPQKTRGLTWLLEAAWENREGLGEGA